MAEKHPPGDIAAALKAAIDATGESLYRVAKDAGVSYPVLNRFYRGERDITIGTASKLTAYLRLELRPAKRTRKGVR